MKNIKLLLFIIVLFYLLIGNIMVYTLTPGANYFFEDKDILKLIKYIKAGKDNEIRELLNKGIDINYIGKDGISPLYYFFIKKDFISFKKALELGADPNADPPKIYRLIDASMRYKDDKFFKLLLEYDVDLNYRPENSEPLLKSALHSTVDIKYLKMLLDKGIGLSYSEFLTNNPLLTALSNREYKKIIILLEYGADLNNTDNFEVYKGKTTIRKLFLERLESNTYAQFEGTKELKEQLELVKYLKEKFNIDVKLKYPNGRPK